MTPIKRDPRAFVSYEGRASSAWMAIVTGCLLMVTGGAVIGSCATGSAYDRLLRRIVDDKREHGEIASLASPPGDEEARRKRPKPQPPTKPPPAPDPKPKTPPDPVVGDVPTYLCPPSPTGGPAPNCRAAQ